MPRRTNEFQRLIAIIQSHLDAGAEVEESAMLNDLGTGTPREVDVSVRGKIGDNTLIISVECRDRQRPSDVTWINEMHGKHGRLPTNLLVLASHSKFTAEAIRVAKDHGIRLIVLEDVSTEAPDRLFPEIKSLWGKVWSLEIQRVSFVVEATETLAEERVAAFPDTTLFLEDGSPYGTALELANLLLRHQPLQRKLGADALPEHKYAELGWERPEHHGKRVCLQKIEPQILRPVGRVIVIAGCKVSASEFPLNHGKYDSVRVSWSQGCLDGNPMMLVATETGNGDTKVSLNPNNASVRSGSA
jgi:hypothetical protein